MWGKARGAIMVAALSVVAPLSAAAQDGSALTSIVELEKRAPAVEGQPAPAPTYVAPDVVVPGDRVRITLTFANRSTAPAAGVHIVNPIPEGLVFDGTADTKDFAVSTDKGKSFGALETLTVAVESGAPRAATTADVTHVRWLWSDAVPAGATRSVAFFGKVK